MNKGNVSNIKPGMLVKLEVSAGSDLGIVSHADTDIFTVLVLNNSGENVPACIGADEIICAWNIAQLPTYIIGDMLQGRASGWTSVLDQAVVYRATRPEAIELTLEEISELASKQLGKPVSVSVKDSKPEEAKPRTAAFVVPEDGVIDRDAQIGEEFEIKGVRYRVIEDTRASRSSCDGCALYDDLLCGRYGGACGELRDDGKSIIFERVPTEDTHGDCTESDRIEVAVGACIERGGITYLCVEDEQQRSAYCANCALDAKFCTDFKCSAACREDGISVHFIKVANTSKAAEQKTTIATEIHNLSDIEPRVGDIIFDNEGKQLKVVESDKGCADCYFCNNDIDDCKHIICAGRHRKDLTNIILQEVEEKE